MARKSRNWPPEGEPLPYPVMDNHTHLPVHEGEIPRADGFRMPLDEQLGRALDVNVTSLITVGCEVPDWEPTLQLAHEYPQVRVALAIHPNEAALHAGHLEKSPDGYDHEILPHHVPLIEALSHLSGLLDDPKVVAVGETGLDYFRTADPGREAQRESFSAHLELARIHNLPVQVHDRDAHGDCVRLLDADASRNQPIVFHSFSGDAEMAREVASRGWFASFSGMLTYPANAHLREALLEMPRELVLVETDAPYLTPVPHRGDPNASYSMIYTVRAIAELWEVADEVACATLMANSRRLYGTW